MLVRVLTFAAILALNLSAIVLTVTSQLSYYIHPRYTPLVFGMAVVSALICAIGLWSEYRVWRGARPADHVHDHDHDHDHDHSHSHAHAHDHDHGDAHDHEHHRHGRGDGFKPPFSVRQVVLATPVLLVLLAAFTLEPQPVSSTATGQTSLLANESKLALAPNTNFEPPAGPTTDYTIADWFYIAQSAGLNGYIGEPASVVGFVYLDKDQPPGTWFVARNAISCCAADTRLFGMLVEGDAPPLPVNTWIRIDGNVESTIVEGRERPLIVDSTVEEVERPKDPYMF